MTSAMTALPGQIPYWAGGAAIGSSLGNRLLGTDQQLSNFGLLSSGGLSGFGLESLGLGGLQNLGSFQSLASLQGLGGLQGLQVIQIPLDNTVNNNMSPCTACIICSPQSASTSMFVFETIQI
ncbi:Uncharacterized protein BM_BM10861 [Brugia malayi]|uniref:Bm10861 n=1 Tax=Brugia malayi TaxID=6279 RepID=A0A0H5SAR1_BRUMA|nr:Uncharacterized protein BM_BM10861 [Brugia malayi]CRZ25676.1 Bm10861 [Brugia malayi]VIO91415.1 Uncharacterized protein BM_BM10861 [Brugia malayi]